MSTSQQPSSSAPFAQSSATERITHQIPSAQSIKDSANCGPETARQQVPGTQQSSQQPISAPFAQRSVTNRIAEQVPSAQSIKESANSGFEAVRQQVPSTQQVSEQLPTVEGTAETLKQGANSLIEGIRRFVLGASNTTLPKVTTEKPADPNDLHVPGGFDNEPVTPLLQETSTASDRLQQSSVLPSQGLSTTTQRPAHAGTGSGIPRDTVESSAEPDVSYEHRPKTLPQSEITDREIGRGLRDGGSKAPEKVEASRKSAHWGPEATASAEAVHEKSEVEKELLRKVEKIPAESVIRVASPGPAAGHSQRSAHSSSYDFNNGSHLSEAATQHSRTIQPTTTVQKHAVSGGVDSTAGVHKGVIGTGHDASTLKQSEPSGVDLMAGVHNGVIGPGHDAHISSGPLALPKYEHTSSDSASKAAPGQPIHVDVKPAELGAGVKNTVVGAGSESTA